MRNSGVRSVAGDGIPAGHAQLSLARRRHRQPGRVRRHSHHAAARHRPRRHGQAAREGGGAAHGPGRYRLHLEMVHEGVTWFGVQGDAGLDAIVEVRTDATPAAARAPRRVAPPPGAGEAPLERATRTMLWRAALMAWRDHPLLGLGPDNFRRGYNRYLGLPHPDPRLHANNFYLETLASLGIAGVAALALVIVGFGRAARRALRRHGTSSTAGPAGDGRGRRPGRVPRPWLLRLLPRIHADIRPAVVPGRPADSPLQRP